MDLSNALHARGMFLMFDVVANHMAATGSPPDIPSLSPFNTPSSFHPFCFIQDDNNQTDVEQCWLGDNVVSLPDINTEDPSIVATMNTWVKNLLSKYQADGLRIDTVKHIRKDFWPEFASSAGVFTIGEVSVCTLYF
jgi:alpha-amylase